MSEERNESASPETNLLLTLIEIASKPELDDFDRVFIYTILAESSTSEPRAAFAARSSKFLHRRESWHRGYYSRQRRIREFRNRLAHGVKADQLALWDDQEEIRDDLRHAIIRVAIRDQPTLMISVLEALLHSTTTEENREPLQLLLAFLRQGHALDNAKPLTAEEATSDDEGKTDDDV